MKRKEIILGVIAIILIVVVAFFIANMLHDNYVKSINKEESKQEKTKKEEKLEVDGVKINFKTYRVDSSFFINVPDSFTMLDEETLRSKYNYNNRPELVFMSKDDKEHIFISTTNQDMSEDGLKEYLNNIIANIGNLTLINNDIYRNYDKTFAKLVTNDGITYYNIRYFTLDNKLVTVEFNGPVTEYDKWEDVINEVMDSICFSEDDIKKYSSN